MQVGFIKSKCCELCPNQERRDGWATTFKLFAWKALAYAPPWDGANVNSNRYQHSCDWTWQQNLPPEMESTFDVTMTVLIESMISIGLMNMSNIYI